MPSTKALEEGAPYSLVQDRWPFGYCRSGQGWEEWQKPLDFCKAKQLACAGRKVCFAATCRPVTSRSWIDCCVMIGLAMTRLIASVRKMFAAWADSHIYCCP